MSDNAVAAIVFCSLIGAAFVLFIVMAITEHREEMARIKARINPVDDEDDD